LIEKSFFYLEKNSSYLLPRYFRPG